VLGVVAIFPMMYEVHGICVEGLRFFLFILCAIHFSDCYCNDHVSSKNGSKFLSEYFFWFTVALGMFIFWVS
jgi:hypothetical protein